LIQGGTAQILKSASVVNNSLQSSTETPFVPFKIKNKKKQIIEGDLFPQNYNFKKKNEQKRPTFLLEIDNSNLDISLEEHTTDDL
jgi:cell division protein YceG involved in septum cleavage